MTDWHNIVVDQYATRDTYDGVTIYSDTGTYYMTIADAASVLAKHCELKARLESRTRAVLIARAIARVSEEHPVANTKIAAIKWLRDTLSDDRLGLKEAKDLVEGTEEVADIFTEARIKNGSPLFSPE